MSLPEVEGTPEPPSRDSVRSRRKRSVRAKTVSIKRMAKWEIELGRTLVPADEIEESIAARPRTRGECAGGVRPCPFVSCKWHLFLDVSDKTGAIKLTFPDLEPDQLAVSCALDVADEGGTTLERVGELANITRERIRQIEVKALASMAKHQEIARLAPGEWGGDGRRRLPVY